MKGPDGGTRPKHRPGCGGPSVTHSFNKHGWSSAPSTEPVSCESTENSLLRPQTLRQTGSRPVTREPSPVVGLQRSRRRHTNPGLPAPARPPWHRPGAWASWGAGGIDGQQWVPLLTDSEKTGERAGVASEPAAGLGPRPQLQGPGGQPDSLHDPQDPR